VARIRSVHPGFFTDESVVELDPQAQVLLIGLWTEADDQGVFEWKPVRLKMRLLPVAMVDVASLLENLAAADAIKRIEVDGASFGLIRNFCKWQRPRKPKAWYPLPVEFREYVAFNAGEFGTDDGSSDESSEPTPPKKRRVRNRGSTKGEKDGTEGSSGALDAELEGRQGPAVSQKSGMSQRMEDGGGRGVPRAKALGPGEAADDPALTLFRSGVDWVQSVTGKPNARCRALVGGWRKDLGDDAGLIELLAEAQRQEIQAPEAWFPKAIAARKARRSDEPAATYEDAIAQRERDPAWQGVQ
jgi:hypothetical protein